MSYLNNKNLEDFQICLREYKGKTHFLWLLVWQAASLGFCWWNKHESLESRYMRYYGQTHDSRNEGVLCMMTD